MSTCCPLEAAGVSIQGTPARITNPLCGRAHSALVPDSSSHPGANRDFCFHHLIPIASLCRRARGVKLNRSKAPRL